MKLEKHPLVENGIIEELKLVNYTSGVGSFTSHKNQTKRNCDLPLNRPGLSQLS